MDRFFGMDRRVKSLSSKQSGVSGGSQEHREHGVAHHRCRHRCLGCADQDANKVNAMQKFDDGHAVCVSNGDGCSGE